MRCCNAAGFDRVSLLSSLMLVLVASRLCAHAQLPSVLTRHQHLRFFHGGNYPYYSLCTGCARRGDFTTATRSRQMPTDCLGSVDLECFTCPACHEEFLGAVTLGEKVSVAHSHSHKPISSMASRRTYLGSAPFAKPSSRRANLSGSTMRARTSIPHHARLATPSLQPRKTMMR